MTLLMSPWPVKMVSRLKPTKWSWSHLDRVPENPSFKVPYGTAVALTQDNISVNLEDLDKQIKTMFTKSVARTSNGQGSLATCNICGNEGPLKTMPRHIEANHITGISHSCHICGKVSRSSKHVSREH